MVRAGSCLGPLLTVLAEQFEIAKQQKILSFNNSSGCTFVYWTAVHGVLNMKKLERFDEHLFHNTQLQQNMFFALFSSWGASVEQLQSKYSDVQEWLS